MAPKRQREAKNRARQAKKKRSGVALNRAEEAPTNAIEPTKITDINNDCLEHIFNYLSLIDLLNVADASKCFKQGVNLSFTAKYGSKKLKLQGIEPSPHQSYEVDDYKICISNLTTCLKFIRSFGHTIDELHINYIGIGRIHCAEVDRYINEYCAETLEFIEIYRAKPYSMNKLKKRFSKVTHVEFENCNLGPQVTNFNEWFPQMSSLRFHGVNKVTDSKCIEKQIPSLSYLTIELVTKKENNSCIGLHVAKLLRSNEQIHNLDIRGWDSNFLQSIRKDSQNLKTLSVCCNRDFTHLEMGTIHFRNINTLNINIDFDDSDQEFPRIPLSFDHLKELSITTNGELNDNFIDFVAEQKSLETLELCYFESEVTDALLNAVNHIKLAEILSSLKELDTNCILHMNEVIQLLNKCNLLEFFNFELDGDSEFDSLKKRLPREWQAKDFEMYVQLSRKRDL